jgi:rare lipoprotein A
MANGKRFDQYGRDAAHKSWPFGTKVRVSYNGRSEVVTISDRGPFIAGRTIDLSKGTARRLGMERAGVGRVQMEILR